VTGPVIFSDRIPAARVRCVPAHRTKMQATCSCIRSNQRMAGTTPARPSVLVDKLCTLPVFIIGKEFAPSVRMVCGSSSIYKDVATAAKSRFVLANFSTLSLLYKDAATVNFRRPTVILTIIEN
jgi:hypothetical protein